MTEICIDCVEIYRFRWPGVLPFDPEIPTRILGRSEPTASRRRGDGERLCAVEAASDGTGG